MGNRWCPIDDRGRISLPAALTEGLTWTEHRTVDCLLVLEPGGRVLLHDWASCAGVVVAKRKELLQAAENDAAAEEMLATLEDRLRRAKIERRQLPLHHPVLGHLFGNSTRGQGVLMVRFPEHLELWPPRYRDERLRDYLSRGDDLP